MCGQTCGVCPFVVLGFGVCVTVSPFTSFRGCLSMLVGGFVLIWLSLFVSVLSLPPVAPAPLSWHDLCCGGYVFGQYYVRSVLFL